MAKLAFKSTGEIRAFYGFGADGNEISPGPEDASYCYMGEARRGMSHSVTIFLQTMVEGLHSPLMIFSANFIRGPLKTEFVLEEATFNGKTVPTDMLEDLDQQSRLNGMILHSLEAFKKGKLPHIDDVYQFGITDRPHQPSKPFLTVVPGGGKKDQSPPKPGAQ